MTLKNPIPTDAPHFSSEKPGGNLHLAPAQKQKHLLLIKWILIALQGSWITGNSNQKSQKSILKSSNLNPLQPEGTWPDQWGSFWGERGGSHQKEVLCSYQVAPLVIKKHFAFSCLQGVPWLCDTFHLVCQVNVSDRLATAMCKIYEKWLQGASVFVKLEPHPMFKSSPNQNQG